MTRRPAKRRSYRDAGASAATGPTRGGMTGAAAEVRVPATTQRHPPAAGSPADSRAGSAAFDARDPYLPPPFAPPPSACVRRPPAASANRERKSERERGPRHPRPPPAAPHDHGLAGDTAGAAAGRGARGLAGGARHVSGDRDDMGSAGNRGGGGRGSDCGPAVRPAGRPLGPGRSPAAGAPGTGRAAAPRGCALPRLGRAAALGPLTQDP